MDELPFVRGSDTSADAASSMLARAPALRARILALIISAPAGHTCDEIEQLTQLRHQTASARIRELVLKDQLRDSGARRVTRSGRQAVVWVATP